MRRLPLLLFVVAGALPLMAASALAAAVRTTAAPPVNSTLPAITGTARVGHALTASNGSWAGASPISYSYQWQRCNSTGSSCSSIGKATDQNYVASSHDADRTLRVAVTATNADGKSQALSTPTGTIASAGTAPSTAKQPNPAGTPQEGRTITVDPGNWSGLKPITFTYQWQSCTTATGTCTNLSGKTSSSFVIGLGQVGTFLRATVVGTNSAGKGTVRSNLTTIVTAKSFAPVNVTRPALSGSATVGSRLSVSTGTWKGAAANGFTYQWSRCNANGTSCANIGGATGQSYGVGQADLGLSLHATVTATNAVGPTSETAASTKIAARLVTTATFRSALRPSQEIRALHGVPSHAAGTFTARVTGKTLHWTLRYSHLSGRPTVTFLSKGFRGRTGPVIERLCRTCLVHTHGTITLTASQLRAMMHGHSYVNVHTKKNKHGEIRGQIKRTS
jgi:uncharacterized protein YukE